MDADDLALFTRSLRDLAARAHGGLDRGLDELGWDEALAVDAPSAVRSLFAVQGETGTTSSALARVLTHALDLSDPPGSGASTVLPPAGSATPPATLDTGGCGWTAWPSPDWPAWSRRASWRRGPTAPSWPAACRPPPSGSTPWWAPTPVSGSCGSTERSRTRDPASSSLPGPGRRPSPSVAGPSATNWSAVPRPCSTWPASTPGDASSSTGPSRRSRPCATGWPRRWWRWRRPRPCSMRPGSIRRRPRPRWPRRSPVARPGRWPGTVNRCWPASASRSTTRSTGSSTGSSCSTPCSARRRA